LDKRVAGKKAELRIAQEKARLRAAKAEHDSMLEGTPAMSAEEQERLMDRIKAANATVAETRSARMRAVMEADAVEADYHRLRMVAGIPSSGGPEGTRRRGSILGGSTVSLSLGDGVSGGARDYASDNDDRSSVDGPSAAEADPAAITLRFATLEQELRQVRGGGGGRGGICQSAIGRRTRHGLCVSVIVPEINGRGGTMRPIPTAPRLVRDSGVCQLSVTNNPRFQRHRLPHFNTVPRSTRREQWLPALSPR
jgi:hypothetical protein